MSEDEKKIGIDVPALLEESADIEDIVEKAAKSAVAGKPAAVDEAQGHRKAWGCHGSSSIVVVANQTAALLKLDKKADKVGKAYKDTPFPKTIPPGSNAYFLHTSKSNTAFGGTNGMLSYAIHVYDEEKKEWVDCGQTVAFRWNTTEGAAHMKTANTAKFETADNERHIRQTGTKYDGMKIVGKILVDGKETPSPVYTFIFNQAEIGSGSKGGACVIS